MRFVHLYMYAGNLPLNPEPQILVWQNLSCTAELLPASAEKKQFRKTPGAHRRLPQVLIQHTCDPKPYKIVGYDPINRGSNP